MDYNIKVSLKEREAEYDRKLEEARKEDERLLAEQEAADNKRQQYYDSRKGMLVYFETNTARLEKIKDWYPRAYRALEKFLPCFVEQPDQMPSCVLHSANGLVRMYFNPKDRRVLTFC